MIFLSCQRNSTKIESKTVSTQREESIPFDSIKSKFLSGDKMVINGWLLLGPITFFDSISIDKARLVGKLVSTDSVNTKYKSWAGSKKVYEIQIDDMDMLPYGDFLDNKVCEYLIPNEETLYILDGVPRDNYARLLESIINKRITNIQRVDAIGATKIWGQNYGKYGAIIIDIQRSSHAQSMYRPYDSSSPLRKIIKIDSTEFYSKKVNFKRFDKPTTIRKVKGLISIKTDSSVIKFRDNLSDENYMEYSVIGQDMMKNWVLIMAQDYNQGYFYLVNQKSLKVDTLFENPMIFGNMIICGSGVVSYDGDPAFLEIRSIEKATLKLVLKFKCKEYGLDIYDLYIRDNTLYLKNHEDTYLKLKIKINAA
jgi:hypothetical protein